MVIIHEAYSLFFKNDYKRRKKKAEGKRLKNKFRKPKYRRRVNGGKGEKRRGKSILNMTGHSQPYL
jgi:hypothetical protein